MGKVDHIFNSSTTLLVNKDGGCSPWVAQKGLSSPCWLKVTQRCFNKELNRKYPSPQFLGLASCITVFLRSIPIFCKF